MRCQELHQHIFSDDVEDAPEVVGDEHQPHVSAGALDSFFGEHVAEGPLPFDGTVRMLHDGLPLLVKFWVRFDVASILLVERRVNIAFNQLPAFIGGA